MQAAPQIRILNYTGRRVIVFASPRDNEGRTLEVMGAASLEVVTEPAAPIDGLPVTVEQNWAIHGLPLPKPGYLFLVTPDVYERALQAERSDVLRVGARRNIRTMATATECLVRPSCSSGDGASDGVPDTEITKDMEVYYGLGDWKESGVPSATEAAEPTERCDGSCRHCAA